MLRIVPLSLRKSSVWGKGRRYYNRGKNLVMRVQRRNAWFARVFEVAKHRLHSVLYGMPRSEFAQTCEYTRPDRYPTVFEGVRRYAADRRIPTRRILSFGCSTGAECFTLRKYFPEAGIIGLDINPKSLNFARQANSDPKIRFLESTPETLIGNGPFDVIFANSVLCRWPLSDHVSDLSRYYPFDQFERVLADFDAALQPGGILVIVNPNYDFRDAEIATGYDALEDDFAIYPGSNPLFDRRGKKTAQSPAVHSVFVKHAVRGPDECVTTSVATGAYNT